jgi:benzoyl-CoA reductase/2-hydroxyglutaryl-CoA dehydratase subunit BcrC/BadD/HgdB
VSAGNGFEQHLCTYARNDLGCILSGEDHKSPVGGLARPDLIVTCNNSCNTIQKWWENVSRYLKVPMVLIDTPFLGRGINRKEVFKYIESQLLDLVSYMEEKRGKKFDWDRLDELVEKSEKSCRLYQKFISLNRTIPAPVSVFDQWAHNFPNLALRFTDKAKSHFELLIGEIEKRIANNISAFSQEKYRVYFDGACPWYGLRSLSTKMSELGIVPVSSYYSELFTFSAIPNSIANGDKPLTTMVKIAGDFPILNAWQGFRIKMAREKIREFSLDGVILGIALSCKPLSSHMPYEQDVLTKEWGVPVVRIEGDLCDHKFYSEEETYIRLGTFAEILESNKKLQEVKYVSNR